jgi:crossover junction endodeoxyribonuclease RuvC
VPRKPIRVLGVDTSLRSTGLGVVQMSGSIMKSVECGTVKNPQKLLHSECLKHLGERVNDIIDRTQPDAAAIEGIFYAKNAKTSMILGEARGVVIAACAIKGIPIYEYAPRKIKQAVVGNGAASKEQVRKMLMRMLALKEEPQEDAGDALAIAVCHLHNRTGYASAKAI